MTSARKWASLPLTFENMRKKHDRKKSLKFLINHRTQQAIALQEYATNDIERELAEQFWREVDRLKRELKEVDDEHVERPGEAATRSGSQHTG